MPNVQQTISTPIGSVSIGSNRIAHALAEAAGRVDDTMLANARLAVCDYVRVQRAVDVPPESIIVHVKSIVLNSCRADTPFDVRQALTARVVEWCIDAYYGCPSADTPADGNAGAS